MRTEPNEPMNPLPSLRSLSEGYNGLTKREYFAGLAMQGLCACSTVEADNDYLTFCSVKIADKLIEALNKQP